MDCTGTLLVIGTNPPSVTTGQRTLARVEQGRAVLGFNEAKVVNLFALPSYRSGGLAELGTTSVGWEKARENLGEGLDEAAGVLLAYGTQMPSGPARQHFHDQVSWLETEIMTRRLPVWWVGGKPRHPSRWQRYTCRAHPGLGFEEALALSLVRRTPSTASVDKPSTAPATV